jgi:muconolactone D-isomerase
MLYFVRAEMKGAPVLPPKQWIELLMKEFKIEIGYQKQGKILAQGHYAGGKGGCYIYDVESNEELHRLICTLPSMAFLDWEVKPLLARN